MTVLPIAERELRVAARAARTYWSRAFVALGAMVLVLVVYGGFEKMVSPRVGGQPLFASLAYLALAYALFTGAGLTADCLSSEKREETLGFLFLTDLKGYDVVLGKLVATSLRSIYGFLATFPVMSLPLLLGGVGMAEVGRVILVMLNTLLLSLAMGLLISTLFRSQRVTTNLAAGLMLAVAVVPMAFGAAIRGASGTGVFPFFPTVLSPIYALQTAFENSYAIARLAGPSFWTALGAQFVTAVLLLARASWLLPRSWQESGPRPQVATVTAVPARPNSGTGRGRVLDQNPFYWLAARGQGATIGLTALVLFVAVWALDVRDDREAFAGAQGVGILLVALVSRLLIAVIAAQRLAEDKQSGALDLIITTPIAVSTIMDGQWRALWRKLGMPLVGSGLLYTYLIFGSEFGEPDSAWLLGFTAFCFLVLSVADFMTLGWLGMWTGLTTRQVPNGAALCLLKVVVPPALVVGALICGLGLTSADQYIQGNRYWVPAVWLLVGVTTDFFWARWATLKLLTEFRVAATNRVAAQGREKRAWWLNLFPMRTRVQTSLAPGRTGGVS